MRSGRESQASREKNELDFSLGVIDNFLMSRIPIPDYDQMNSEMKAAFDEQVKLYGRMTNMKKTLTHSPVAFRALMTWYDLQNEVRPFLGDRLTNLFSHSISSETDCLICSTFFRRILIDAGENPDQLALDERESAVVEFGRHIAKNANAVKPTLMSRLKNFFSDQQMVSLTAFGAMMVATNVFNNALDIKLDDYLISYRKNKTP
jgi:alkylhydroperoxidase family enzyme